MEVLAVSGVCIVIATAGFSTGVRKLLVTFLSTLLNHYYHWKYPIRDVSREKKIPSLPYTWPNGTGDTAKFINGPRNSRIWRQKYGDIYRLWAGSTPEIVVSDPIHLKEIFSDSDRHSKAENNDSGYLMSQILGKCIGLLSPPEWKAARTKLEYPFTHRAIESSAPMMLKVTKQYFDEFFRAETFQEVHLDPMKDLEFYPFLITATLIYGELDASQTQNLKEIMPLRIELFTYVFKGGLSRFAISKYLPTRFNHLLREFQTKWKEFNRQVYLDKTSKMLDVPIVSFWNLMVAGGILEEQLLQTLDEALFANLDVTSSVVAWNLVFLAAYPAVQARLHEEIGNATADGPDVLRSYIKNDKTYLAACIKETARHRPILSFSIPQAPPTDRIVGDWLLPKNTMVIVDTFAVNMRREFWGKDAHDYRPSRFQEVNEASNRYQLWRYGLGPRQCMGKYLADFMLRALLCHLVGRISLENAEPGGDLNELLNDDMKMWVRTPQTKLRCKLRNCSSVPVSG
ncbi:unnamed protein product [Periconia digitata]|uniref:Cytochrome P450 n=1 Tax=Periconia digitata TaxID=1303443 RepID=A0A9W4XM50_9PLEO|nr:unnamed protein product [Periconia digitata]